MLVGIAAVVILVILSRSGDERTAIGPDVPLVSDAEVQFSMREQELSALLKKEPDNAVLHAELGDVYFESNRFEPAVGHYRKAVELDPRDADSFNDLGLALFYTGDTDAALQALRRATEADPGMQRAWLSRGYVLARAGRNVEAREALGRAIELAPGTMVASEARNILSQLP